MPAGNRRPSGRWGLIDRYQGSHRRSGAAGDTEGRESVALHTYGFPFRP
ncbi:hypothetical protein SCALM49S_08011 [Streptomyces californicus]